MIHSIALCDLEAKKIFGSEKRSLHKGRVPQLHRIRDGLALGVSCF